MKSEKVDMLVVSLVIFTQLVIAFCVCWFIVSSLHFIIVGVWSPFSILTDALCAFPLLLVSLLIVLLKDVMHDS